MKKKRAEETKEETKRVDHAGHVAMEIEDDMEGLECQTSEAFRQELGQKRQAQEAITGAVDNRQLDKRQKTI